MLDKLIRNIADALNIQDAKTRTELIYSIERNIGQSSFTKSAYMCEQFLRASGFQDVKMIPIKADGITTNLDCTMPQAWDRTGRSFFKLDVPGLTEEEAMICDTNEIPLAVGMWSAPSAPEGFSGEVVDWAGVDHENPDVKGKIVMVFDPDFTPAYNKCNKAGAIACLACDSKSPVITADDYRWSNGISCQGWYHVREDLRGTFLSITPRKAMMIRNLIAEGKKVVGHGVVNTKIYDGEINTVTGIIPGETAKEIVLIAHIYEPFETDDANGAALSIAVATAIRDLVAAGKLPPLKKTLRVLIGMELYGFSAWFANKANVNRIEHVFSFDATCHISEDENGIKHNRVRQTFDAAPSFTDWILTDALAHFPNIEIEEEAGNLSDDTFMSEAAIGIPTNWINNSRFTYHHNTHPNFSKPDWDMARCACAAIGTAIAVLACFGKEDYQEIAPILTRKAEKAFNEKLKECLTAYKKGEMLPYFALGRLIHFRDAMIARIVKLNQYAPDTIKAIDIRKKFNTIAEPAIKLLSEDSTNRMPHTLLHAANMIIRDRVPGTLASLARIPYAERKPLNDFGSTHIVLGFCDGKNTLADAILKMQYVQNVVLTKQQIKDIIADFKYLAKYGYFTIEEKYHTTPEQFDNVLGKLGLKKGMKVMVHCAFSSLGKVEGSPEAIAKVLMDRVGEEGFLMMPTFNFFKFPEDGIFDPDTTPSSCGILSNTFRKMPGVIRSLNPTHSFAAYGAEAKEIMDKHHKVCVLGEDSPLDILKKEDGWCLAIQCPTEITYMHTVEFSLKVKCLEAFGEEYPVRFPDGSVKKVATWSWRAGYCKQGPLTQTWRLMHRRKLVREADIANAHILFFKLQDFHACHEAVLKGRNGCANCNVLPRIVDATTDDVRSKYNQ